MFQTLHEMSFPLKQTFWPSLNASIWLILTSSWLYSIDYKAKGSIFKVRKSFSLLFIPAFSMQKWTKYMYVMFLICKSLQSKHVSIFFLKIIHFMIHAISQSSLMQFKNNCKTTKRRSSPPNHQIYSNHIVVHVTVYIRPFIRIVYYVILH